MSSTSQREAWFRAPGRINLIGGHSDYNEGFVLPVAVDLACTVRSRPRDDRIVRVTSQNAEGVIEIAADGSTLPEEVDQVWGRYWASSGHMPRAYVFRGVDGAEQIPAQALP